MASGSRFADERPIFIVGPSRSGTSLIMRILRRQPNVYVAGETHYFGDLRTRTRGRWDTPLSKADRAACEDYFLAIADKGYDRHGDPRNSPLDRAALRERADEIGVGADAYFVAFCKLRAEAYDSARWGEKTPRHVYAIDEMLEAFPGAQVLCMVRDPRGVISSYRDMARPTANVHVARGRAPRSAHVRKRRSYDLIVASLLWRSTVNKATAAVHRHGDARVRLLRYEDLVGDPVAAVSRLTAWLGVDFDEQMLDVDVENSTYTHPGTVSGLMSRSVDRWRDRMSDEELAAVEALCRPVMAQFGYAPVTTRPARLFLLRNLLTLPYTSVRATLANRNRTGSLLPYVWERVRAIARVPTRL